jgi:hypothetical protein
MWAYPYGFAKSLFIERPVIITKTRLDHEAGYAGLGFGVFRH